MDFLYFQRGSSFLYLGTFSKRKLSSTIPDNLSHSGFVGSVIKQKIYLRDQHNSGMVITEQWRRQASEFGGAFEGQTHILGGQDIIFKKVLLFAHAVVTGLLSPPPGDSPPSQKGAIFLGIPPPGDEYPRNIAPPPEGLKAHTDRTLFGNATRIFSFQ